MRPWVVSVEDVEADEAFRVDKELYAFAIFDGLHSHLEYMSPSRCSSMSSVFGCSGGLKHFRHPRLLGT